MSFGPCLRPLFKHRVKVRLEQAILHDAIFLKLTLSVGLCDLGPDLTGILERLRYRIGSRGGAEARRWGSGIERLLNLGAAANGNGDSEPMDRRHPNYPQIYFNHPHNARNAILAALIPHPTHSISGLVVAKHTCVGYI